ncbi:hypothetical protein F3Y22_tig00110474pilonHSYRG00232 [Hibiscus syriacus]|uniref:Uncharacterized protein n=1 Tax=Hibiscus syriacus TaxID=106335 RepID=A0A6A3AK56_HIBSY|nr:hypothetical protein F3Y22_tig00110474pilonHSYRG00232 [Hibiscus syriacus]
MDFDEYEYLEKAVENLEPQKSKNEDGNDSFNAVKSERSRNRSSKHKREERADDSDDYNHLSKHSKSKEDSWQDHDRHKERGLSHRQSQSRDGRRIGTKVVENTEPRTPRIGKREMGGKERRNVLGKTVIVKVRGTDKGKGRESGQGEAGVDQKENQTRVMTESLEKEKRKGSQGNKTEKAVISCQ